MYEDGTLISGNGPMLGAAAVRAMVQAVATTDGPVGVGVEVDAERVALLEALEDLKNAAAGLQVVVTAAFDASQSAAGRCWGVGPTGRARGRRAGRPGTAVLAAPGCAAPVAGPGRIGRAAALARGTACGSDQ